MNSTAAEEHEGVASQSAYTSLAGAAGCDFPRRSLAG